MHIHTQERKHIALSNYPHFHFVGVILTGEESLLPPSILKMPTRPATILRKGKADDLCNLKNERES